MFPDIEEVQGGEMSPQLLGWIDVADVLRAFLQREGPAWPGRVLGWEGAGRWPACCVPPCSVSQGRSCVCSGFGAARRTHRGGSAC